MAPTLLDRPDVAVLLDELRALTVPCAAIRTHGDFHIGRVARTEQGWYVTDFSSGGRPVIAAGIVDSPAAADAAEPTSPSTGPRWPTWPTCCGRSGQVAADAAVERDPTGREGLGELAEAWELRNRRAFFAGYLGVAGISGLVPPGREAVRVLVERLRARAGGGPDGPAAPTVRSAG